ncbi:MAG: DUF1127 domain-containing protein [Rhodospirillales bacterium]|nr:DUF1127 domain-containing protein [Rhodospirillales bacterium]MCW8863078.1 DUF1127 domain-containing protein [Rhodospirillales bacterium]MCW8951133.1 DUF1127 domain-containing protein [Rhodospirillales bacterium]MCW8970812.1 DUF1127 domain-containing protein [Rhodospirillales bacterium]MCW9002846.1 DUF1127 domain-containing protein [Rhodospirillales bacterium]
MVIINFFIGVFDALTRWADRIEGRRRLMALDDCALKDLGLTRCDAEKEWGKPFWRR